MATLEQRGSSMRLNWRLGGGTGPRQSCTFSGGTERENTKLAKAAKALVESRDHCMTRSEVYDVILGPAEDQHAHVPTFTAWVATYLAQRRKMPDIQQDVVQSYEWILNARAVPFLGNYRLTEITPDLLNEWVAWLAKQPILVGNRIKRAGNRPISPTTVRRVHSIVHGCLSDAVPKWIPVNPAARPAGASKRSRGLPKKTKFPAVFLKPDDVNRLLDCCDPAIRDMVDVAVHSGLRLGELVALKVGNVVWDRNGRATIRVREALKNDGTIGTPKSEMSSRDVTLNSHASQLLRGVTTGRPPSAFAFTSPMGARWDVWNLRHRHWDPAVGRAQRCPEHPPPTPPKPRRGPVRALRPDEVSTCPCPGRLHQRPRFHDLRHTHASLCIDEGMHAKKIQVRLGHATYQITMDVYGHLMEGADQDEIDRIGDRLARRDVA